jgi:Glyoxalase-like domain
MTVRTSRVGPHAAPGALGCLRTLAGMACRISELVIDAADPGLLAAFWSKVLGYVELGREDDGSIEIGPPDGFGGHQPTVVLSPSSDPRTGKLRLHVDVNATDRDQDAELDRLLALGARPVDIGQTGTESWHVLADPEGNEFCLLRARLRPL